MSSFLNYHLHQIWLLINEEEKIPPCKDFCLFLSS